jgi:hypothetical protein
LVVMANHRHCGPNVESTPSHKRNLCDVEAAELRK